MQKERSIFISQTITIKKLLVVLKNNLTLNTLIGTYQGWAKSNKWANIIKICLANKRTNCPCPCSLSNYLVFLNVLNWWIHNNILYHVICLPLVKNLNEMLLEASARIFHWKGNNYDYWDRVSYVGLNFSCKNSDSL